MPTIDAADLAADILAQLGQDFTVPPVDLTGAEYQIPTTSDFAGDVTSVDVADLTTGAVGGTGAFDRIMSSHKAHLKEQYEKGLITGDQYTKAYIELTSVAMSSGVQMVLGKDQAYWQAKTMQMQGRKAEIEAVAARVQLETAKAQLAAANRQAELTNAQYVLTLVQTAAEDAKYRLANAQLDLVGEQTEAAHAQTSDTLRDGVTPVAGSVGKQNELYTQQIDSFHKDSRQKVAKMYLDGWITQKTLDESTLAPNQLTNNEIDLVLSSIRAGNDL